MRSRKLLADWLVVAVLFGGFATYSPELAEAQRVVTKRCGKCGSYAPISARVGDICPSCGARWGSERDYYVDSGSSNSGSQPQITPQQMLATWQAMIQQQREMQRQAERERRTAQMQAIRDEQTAKRTALYDRLRERTEAFHGQDDPSQRVARHLISAVRAENEGNLLAAAAYYRLVIRSLPDTSAADQATMALSRLGGK